MSFPSPFTNPQLIFSVYHGNGKVGRWEGKEMGRGREWPVERETHHNQKLHSIDEETESPRGTWLTKVTWWSLQTCFLASGHVPFLYVMNFAACMSLNTQTKTYWLIVQDESLIIRMKRSLVGIEKKKKRKIPDLNPASYLEEWLTLILQVACFPLKYLIGSVPCSPRLHKEQWWILWLDPKFPRPKIITVLFSMGGEDVY